MITNFKGIFSGLLFCPTRSSAWQLEKSHNQISKQSCSHFLSLQMLCSFSLHDDGLQFFKIHIHICTCYVYLFIYTPGGGKGGKTLFERGELIREGLTWGGVLRTLETFGQMMILMCFILTSHLLIFFFFNIFLL